MAKKAGGRKVKAASYFSGSFGKKINGMPNEIKVVGALAAMLVLLYIFQMLSTPSFFNSQVKGVTGLIISDTASDEQQPVQAQPTAEPKPAPAAAPQVQAPKPALPQNAAKIKITSPAKGSTQSDAFTVEVELGTDPFICYFQVKDGDTTTWDRRMKPCKSSFTVENEYCKTPGRNTCYVYVEQADQDRNMVSSDSAYYSIQ